MVSCIKTLSDGCTTKLANTSGVPQMGYESSHANPCSKSLRNYFRSDEQTAYIGGKWRAAHTRNCECNKSVCKQEHVCCFCQRHVVFMLNWGTENEFELCCIFFVEILMQWFYFGFECHFSYTGYCPQFIYRVGNTYSSLSHKLLIDPTVAHAEKLVLSDRATDEYQVE